MRTVREYLSELKNIGFSDDDGDWKFELGFTAKSVAELLTKNELLCQHYQARFRHVLVDEFQDTNRLQYRWLNLKRARGRPSSDMQSEVPPKKPS